MGTSHHSYDGGTELKANNSTALFLRRDSCGRGSWGIMPLLSVTAGSVCVETICGAQTDGLTWVTEQWTFLEMSYYMHPNQVFEQVWYRINCLLTARERNFRLLNGMPTFLVHCVVEHFAVNMSGTGNGGCVKMEVGAAASGEVPELHWQSLDFACRMFLVKCLVCLLRRSQVGSNCWE